MNLWRVLGESNVSLEGSVKLGGWDVGGEIGRGREVELRSSHRVEEGRDDCRGGREREDRGEFVELFKRGPTRKTDR